jgi:hypothetical protein
MRTLVHWTTLAIVLALAGCGGQPGAVSPDLLAVDLAPACGAGAYSSQIVTTCRAQHPPPEEPSPGQPGAICGSNSECVGGICLMPFGSSEHYCTQNCDANGACPKGYSCEDSGPSYGAVCYLGGPCVYAGGDSAECVTELNLEATTACTAGCDQAFATWLACIARQPLLCSQADAHTACGIERGELDSCCPGCNHQDL